MATNLRKINPKVCGDKAGHCRLIVRLFYHGDQGMLSEGPDILKRVFYENDKFYYRCIKCNEICRLSRLNMGTNDINPPRPLTDIAEMIDTYLAHQEQGKRYVTDFKKLELNCPNLCRPKYIMNLEKLTGQVSLETCSMPIQVWTNDGSGIFKRAKTSTWTGFRKQRKMRFKKGDFDLHFDD